jgi:hypothetical protein
MAQFVSFLWDLFAICMATILILFPWRLFGKLPTSIMDKYHQRATLRSNNLRPPYAWIDHLPQCIWNQLGWAFIDFLAFLASIVIFVTMYRVPALIRECQRRRQPHAFAPGVPNTSDWYRQSVWDQFFGILCDFPFIWMVPYLSLALFPYASIIIVRD